MAKGDRTKVLRVQARLLGYEIVCNDNMFSNERWEWRLADDESVTFFLTELQTIKHALRHAKDGTGGCFRL